MKIIAQLLSIVFFVMTAMQSFASTFVGGRTDFRDETIYFVMTTRFYDGDKSNNTYCWDGTLNQNDPEWRGDFKGLIEKLDYIKALGFTAVWITPVVENASGLDYHGYHAMNFSKVDHRYESNDCKFQDLIDAAHARGMKIILDIVLQHNGNFGEENLCPMFAKDYSVNPSNMSKYLKRHPYSKLPENYNSLSADNQYSSRINLMKNLDRVNHDNHNYWHHVGNNWDWDDYSRVWGQIAGDCVDLNTEHPHVYNYLIDCYTKFIEMGVDGFRIDTGGHIARLTFNKAFIPGFLAAGEKYKDKRGGTPFFMYTEVCARAEEVIYRNGNYNCSPCFYTWKETKDYPWLTDEESWDKYEVWEGEFGEHPNALSVLQQGKDYGGHADNILSKSDNAFLRGNAYHETDYSEFSGMSVIDFPMHWRFASAENAFGVRAEDNLYNDSRYNVTYVDSHDYGPNGQDKCRFAGGTAKWAENLDLMFTWRGIPCIFYGSEIEFRKGKTIDEGPYLALDKSGRAYFGGYITGSVQVEDFAVYVNPVGNMAATLANPLALHIQRLNLIRAAIPALRKGQYSTEGCTGKMAFKRRYTDDTTDSYVLVTISGDAVFKGVLNGTYVDAVTGDVKVVTDNSLSTSGCSTQGAMRVYVLSTDKTPAPGKVGDDGKFLYTVSPVSLTQPEYDGNEEAKDNDTKRDTSGGDVVEPENPIEPSMEKGEQAVFFENASGWNGSINAYVWNNGTEFTGKWTGEPCKYLGNKIWKWTYKGTGKIPDGSGLIFNNGQSQTSDFVWKNGGYYDATGYVKTIEGAGVIPDDSAGEETTWKFFYEDVNFGESTVYAYVWDAGSGNKQYLGAWPGKPMTKGENGMWEISFSTTDKLVTPMIIFHNNRGTQTKDLVAINYGIYLFSGFNRSGVSVSQVNSNLEIWTSDGILYVENRGAECCINVVSVDGTVRHFIVETGRSTITSIPAGFYVVNGTKLRL